MDALRAAKVKTALDYSSTAPREAEVTSLAYRARYPVLFSRWAGLCPPHRVPGEEGSAQRK